MMPREYLSSGGEQFCGKEQKPNFNTRDEDNKMRHEGMGRKENKKGYKNRRWKVDKGALRWGRKG
jgi:hypothetical protein